VSDRNLYHHIGLGIGILIFPIVSNTVEDAFFHIHEHWQSRVGVIQALPCFRNPGGEITIGGTTPEPGL